MKRLPIKMKGFLAAYAKCGSIKRAAKTLRMSRFTHCTWMEKFPEYRALFMKAHSQAMQALEDKAQQLATEGRKVLVVHNGQPVFVWRDVDGNIVPQGDKAAVHREALYNYEVVPSLLIFKLKGEFPEKYRDRQQVDVTTAGQPLNQPHPTQKLMQQVMADPKAYEAAAILADRMQTVSEPDGSPASN